MNNFYISNKNIENYNDIFNPNMKISKFLYKYKNIKNESYHSEIIKLTGRIIAFRKMGKITFLQFYDQTGLLQAILQKNIIGEKLYSYLKQFNVGDIIGVQGIPFYTKTNELSIKTKKIVLLVKNINLLPEKWHGLTNIEEIYRKRYLDLIFNKKSRSTFILRSLIIDNIRTFLKKDGFLEIESPILLNISGGANAQPFKTFHNAHNEILELRIATEIYLKKLIVGGLDKVYEIGRSFRNEGISTKHNPEFTSIEFYKTFTTYKDLMLMTETFFSLLSKKIFNNFFFNFNNNIIIFKTPFKKISFLNIVKKYISSKINNINTLYKNINIKEIIYLSNRFHINKKEIILTCLSEIEYIDLLELMHIYKFKIYTTNINLLINKFIEKIINNNYEYNLYLLFKFTEAANNIKKNYNNKIILILLYKIFEKNIENTIIQPTFITELPITISPLSSKNKFNPLVADRFELFCGGMEIANAFSEINNSYEQRKRFVYQNQQQQLKKIQSLIDENFLTTLSYGMPPTAGEGIGIDRLTMILSNNKSIKDVILFPKMKKK